MTKNKDLTRLVRARMAKTGESYTAARAQITRNGTSGSPPRAQWPELAGMSDEAVRAKTDRDWAGWVKVLDAAGCQQMDHAAIARLVRAEYDVSGWWAQTVTVGYERIRGLRQKHQRRGGLFDANKSKTFPVPVSALYAAFSQKRQRSRWLGDLPFEVRTSRKDTSLRAVLDDDLRLDAHFTDKGPNKSSVALQLRGLPSRDAVEHAKAEWAQRLSALGAQLKD